MIPLNLIIIVLKSIAVYSIYLFNKIQYLKYRAPLVGSRGRVII